MKFENQAKGARRSARSKKLLGAPGLTARSDRTLRSGLLAVRRTEQGSFATHVTRSYERGPASRSSTRNTGSTGRTEGPSPLSSPPEETEETEAKTD